MPIINKRNWKKWIKANEKDPMGKACIDLVCRVMQILDEEPDEFDDNALIYKAVLEIKSSNLSLFMVGHVAFIVSKCHSCGEEFRRVWNLDIQMHDEGAKANKGGSVLNPAYYG